MRISDIIKGLAALGTPQFKRNSSGAVAGLAGDGGRTILEVRPPSRKDNFWVKAPGVIDDMAAAVGSTTLAWTRAAGTCVMANSTDFLLSGAGCTNALKLTNLSSFEKVQKNIPGIVPNVGTLTVAVYISEMPVDYTPAAPTAPTYRACDIQIQLCTDANFVAGTSVGIATGVDMTSAQFLRAGWNFLQLNTLDDGTLNTTGNPAWAYTGTGPGTAATTYNYVRLVIGGFQPATSTTPVIYICGIFQDARSTSQVLINLDDGHVDTIDIAALAKRYGFNISSSVITGTVGIGAQMSWAQHRAMQDAGHDIIAHSRTHPIAGFDTLTPAQLADELLCGADLVANGLSRTSDVLAYPENIFNKVVADASRAAGFTMARASKPGWQPTAFGIGNPMALGSRDIGGKTCTQAKKYLDAAQTYNCLAIIYAHRIFTATITSMTYSGGIVTVTSTSHGYSVGNTVHHRGADQDYFNVSGIVETVADANHYTFKVTGTFTITTATSATGNLRSFSPNYPTLDATPPANTLYWYWSAYIGLFADIAARRNAGTLTPTTYSVLLDRCTLLT